MTRTLALLALLLTACEQKKNVAPPAPKPAVTATATALRGRSAPERLVAIGDLHGDLAAARRALLLAGAIDAKDTWVGGRLVVVQTGDEIDRGDDDRQILDLFERLGVDARAAGGDVVALAGNHELMNAALDFRYVTPGAFATFADVHAPDSVLARVASAKPSEHARAGAFAPGGPYAMKIAERPVAVKIGTSVFVHGGILPKHVRYGIDRMNDEVRAWLRGDRAECPPSVCAEDGAVWARNYSAAPGPDDCATLGEALAGLGAQRMVVGHTVQRNGINAACDGRAWRIDTGMAKVFEGKTEVLEIRGEAVTVLRRDGG